MRVGNQVKATGRDGTVHDGKIVVVRNSERGKWYDVNVSRDKKKREIKSFRAAQLQPA